MDFWMIARQCLKNDLMDIFSALGDLQYRFDWVISDHDMWYSQNCPEDVKKRWQWTGLLMSGQELTEHYAAGYVWFCIGGVLSAVPKGTDQSQIDRFTPCWEQEDLFTPKYQFQMPLTRLELICYDGYAWLIVCATEFSERVHQALPQAKRPGDFFSDK